MTVAAVVRIVTGRMEGCLLWNISVGGDAPVDDSLPVDELDVPTHVGEVEVQGRVLVQPDGQGARVSAPDHVTLFIRPIAVDNLVLVGDKQTFL